MVTDAFHLCKVLRASRAFQGDIGENHQPVPPMMLEVSECDMRVTVNKSCALAAQTFMIAMANEGYDTCPLEGFDSRRMKKLLKLPHGAGINMVIPCGIRDGNKGIWENGAGFLSMKSIIGYKRTGYSWRVMKVYSLRYSISMPNRSS